MTVLLHGLPAPGLVDVPAGAVQVSPRIPGSEDLAAMADATVDQAIILAPPGVLERDHLLAQTLRLLKPGAPLTAFAPKDKGGSRLRATLERFGCAVAEDARKHHRVCHVVRPGKLEGLGEAIAAGAPRLDPALGLWTQPGVFSWDRIDPGSLRLVELLPELSGRGADLGCGLGVLAARVLASTKVTALIGFDIDRRAVACAAHNLDDPRVSLRWADVRRLDDPPVDLDFVVMNPPFHDGGAENRDLGVAFVRAAAGLLRKGGVCWLVANRHLPYEAALKTAFSRVDLRADAGGYKIIEARR